MDGNDHKTGILPLMKKYLLLFLSIAFLGFVSVAYAAPAFVQATSTNSGSTSKVSSTATFGSNTTAGNLIVVGFGYVSNTVNASSVTDSQGNVFTKAIGPTRQSAIPWSNYIYYATSTAGGTKDVVNVRLSATAAFFRVFVHEFSGANTLDVIGSSTGTSGNLATAAVITTQLQEAVLGMGISNSGGNATGTNYIQATRDSTGEMTEYRILSATSSETAPQTSGGGQWIDQLAGFYLTSAPSNTPAGNFRWRGIFQWIGSFIFR